MPKKTIDFALSTMPGSADTPADKVKTSKALIVTVMASPDYTPGSALDNALQDFSGETNKLETLNQGVVEADLAAGVARTAQVGGLRRWSQTKRALCTAVNMFCNGSKEKIQGFGFGTVDREETPLAVVPEGLRPRRTKEAGVAAVRWDAQPGVDTYMVQYASDAADPATYATPKASSRVSFALVGQTPGATVHFRVYAIDPRLPSGQTDYCAWVAVKAGV